MCQLEKKGLHENFTHRSAESPSGIEIPQTDNRFSRRLLGCHTDQELIFRRQLIQRKSCVIPFRDAGGRALMVARCRPVAQWWQKDGPLKPASRVNPGLKLLKIWGHSVGDYVGIMVVVLLAGFL